MTKAEIGGFDIGMPRRAAGNGSGRSRGGWRPIALVYLFLGAQAATAADKGGADDAQGLLMVHHVAECTVRKHRASATEILAYIPQSLQSGLAFHRTNPGECMDVTEGVVTMKDFFMRGALAERLLRQDFSAIGVFSGGKLPAIFKQPTGKSFQRLEPEVKLELAMIAVGECVTRAEPGQVYALFATEVRSQGESTALRALVPQLQGCIAQGQSFQLNLAAARAFLGEGAYRVSVKQAMSQREAAK
jgi:hypothetical protein